MRCSDWKLALAVCAPVKKLRAEIHHALVQHSRRQQRAPHAPHLPGTCLGGSAAQASCTPSLSRPAPGVRASPSDIQNAAQGRDLAA